jgi:UDP:flavonoid glycosyltransferase YjiC (YdhE family)
LPEGYTSFPKSVCIGINPVILESDNQGVFALGLPYEDSPAVRARNQLIASLIKNFVWTDLNERHAEVLQEAGCTRLPDHWTFGDVLLASDVILQLSGPSFEYPDPLMDPKLQFIGTLPPKAVAADQEYPTWWPDVIEARAAGKKVVFLAQGTLDYSPEDILLPGIRALADEPDVLLVVTIGQRGGSLPADFAVPANTRVIDYFPYDVMLPHADAFVFNAGFGGASHAIGHAVPIVVVGQMGQDKAEVRARIEWSGLGVGVPEGPIRDPAVARDAVLRVLRDPAYKEAALKLQKESIELDPFTQVEKKIRELSSSA